MKNQQFFIFLTFIMLLLFIKCEIICLPFLTGKYIYWLITFIVWAAYFFFTESRKVISINRFDVCMLLLFGVSVWNFTYISKVTVFNLKLWYFIAYLLLYIILRQCLNTKEIIYKSLRYLHHFIVFAAILNAVIAVMQENHFLVSKNQYFLVSGLFYSPNQLGLFMAIGCLSAVELIKKFQDFNIKMMFGISLLILFYGLYLSHCRGAYLALGISLFYIFYKSKKSIFSSKWSAVIFVIPILCVLLLLINTTNTIKSESASGRLFITERVLDQIKNQFLTGYGFDSFALEYNKAKAAYFESERPWQEVKNAGYIYNANNDFLELTFEFGIIWMLVFILFIFMLFSYSNQNNEIKSCFALLLCLIVFALTNSVLSVPLFIFLGCCFTIIIINTIKIDPLFSFDNYLLLKITGLIFSFLFLLIIILRINAEYKLLNFYNGKAPFSDLKTVENYAGKIDSNGEQFFMTGGILLKNKYTKEGTLYLAKGFELSGKPSLGKILAGIYEKQGLLDEAEKIYRYNINVEPFRYEPRIDLFHLYVKTNQIIKAKETAKKIIDLPIKIPSDKIDRFKEEAKFYISNGNKIQIKTP